MKFKKKTEISTNHILKFQKQGFYQKKSFSFSKLTKV